MNAALCLELAGRIDALLRHALAQGIDPRRMAAETLYARDVLLVCDAMHTTEGPALARQFRAARRTPPAPVATTSASRTARRAAPAPVSASAPASAPSPAAASGGFNPSRWFSSMFGNSGAPSTMSLQSEPAEMPGAVMSRPRARRWLDWARGGAK